MIFITLFVSVALLKVAHGFGISSIRASQGEDVHRPAQSGDEAQDIELICQLQLNPGDHWTSCAWTHEFQDVWGLTNRQGYVMCSVGSINDNGKYCNDVGNLIISQSYGGYDQDNAWVGPYVERLTHITAETYCGLRISKPNANDTGIWKCLVNDNSASSIFREEINLFVANKSEVVITEPVRRNGGDNSIWTDITTGQTEIRATCESRYGVPPPQLSWYIDEPRNKISDNDARISTTTTTSNSAQGSNIEITKSSISMEINERSLNAYGVRGEHGFFSFSLGCYPRQDTYFPQVGFSQNPAEVMVFGKNGASSIFPVTTILIILFNIVTAIKFF